MYNNKSENKKIFYLTYFDYLEKENIRNVSPAAIVKSKYIAKTLTKIGNDVQIVSPALPNKPGKYPASNLEIYKNVKLKLFKSFYTKRKLLRLFRRVSHSIKTYCYLLFKIPRNSKVIVYHSLSLMKKIKTLKKIKNIKLILEFNEIYGDVINDSSMSKKEIFYSKKADAYIFPTELLEEKINTDKKPFIINYGTYEKNSKTDNKFDDGLIHCVYSGTFSIEKGGVTNAINAALYLNEKYHLHILGFGKKEEVKLVEQSIMDMKVKTKCKITYDGLLLGDEFDQFINKCHIGLSTQSLDNNFNDTSFPSKVLMYMSNNLKVVSVKMPVLTRSFMKNYISFYTEDSPKSIAEAIINVDLKNEKDSSKDIISVLDRNFTNDLKKILTEI